MEERFLRVVRDKILVKPGGERVSIDEVQKILISKTINFCTKILVGAGVPVYMAEQRPGDIVITFPKAFHAGCSTGFNIGEATNFANEHWVQWGLEA